MWDPSLHFWESLRAGVLGCSLPSYTELMKGLMAAKVRLSGIGLIVGKVYRNAE